MKNKLKFIENTSQEELPGEIYGRNFGSKKSAKADAKYYMAQIAFTHGFKYIYFKNIVTDKKFKGYKYFGSFVATNIFKNGYEIVLDYYNHDSVEFHKRRLSKTIALSILIPMSIVVIGLLVLLIVF